MKDRFTTIVTLVMLSWAMIFDIGMHDPLPGPRQSDADIQWRSYALKVFCAFFDIVMVFITFLVMQC